MGVYLDLSLFSISWPDLYTQILSTRNSITSRQISPRFALMNTLVLFSMHPKDFVNFAFYFERFFFSSPPSPLIRSKTILKSSSMLVNEVPFLLYNSPPKTHMRHILTCQSRI